MMVVTWRLIRCSFDGATHHALEDIAMMRTLLG